MSCLGGALHSSKRLTPLLLLHSTQEREQHRETLAAEADKAFAEFLSEVNESYDVFRTVANHITTLGQSSATDHSKSGADRDLIRQTACFLWPTPRTSPATASLC